MQISGTVTRKSNGTIEIQPSDAGTFNKLPAMGDEVSLTVEVTRGAAEIEQANAVARRARVTRLDGQPDVAGEDGLIHGDLAPDTGERLAPAEPGAPNVTGIARADRRKK
jgi:hypothetical protein